MLQTNESKIEGGKREYDEDEDEIRNRTHEMLFSDWRESLLIEIDWILCKLIKRL